jgi:hypothetical protein
VSNLKIVLKSVKNLKKNSPSPAVPPLLCPIDAAGSSDNAGRAAYSSVADGCITASTTSLLHARGPVGRHDASLTCTAASTMTDVAPTTPSLFRAAAAAHQQLACDERPVGVPPLILRSDLI